MRLHDLGLLFLLAAMWGASFLFIRVAAPALGPLALVEGRVLLAAVLLLLYAAAIRRPPALRARWKEYLLLGTVNSALPFVLIAAAELRLTASLAAILNATTPLFAALVAAVWLRERVTPTRAAGLLLGLVGVAILVGWSPLRLDAAALLAIAASLGGAIFYALGGVYAARAFKGVPPLDLSIGQLLGASVVLLPPAAARPPAAMPSPGVALAFLALTLLATAAGYLIYFRLIANVGPTKTLTVTILVPCFGLLWGALFLREPVGPGTLAGLAVVLASVALVTGLRLPAPARAPSRTYAPTAPRPRDGSR